MSKKHQNKRGTGYNSQKQQSTHKIPSSFAQCAERYFGTLDPNSTIAQLAIASENDAEVPRHKIQRGIEKLEEYRDDELFHAMKDGDSDPQPSKEIKYLLKLLRGALTAKSDSSSVVTVNLPEDAKFAQFASLKVPGGRDRFTAMRLPKLLAELGADADSIVVQVQDRWQSCNSSDRAREVVFTEADLAKVLRWHLRGLSVGAAVRKVRVDLEITANYLSA
ncbi:hypothetical protein ACQ4M3_39550 [Leptolyngbya sp. AN03gr2]|uniref:hypothetical protein n=1 Tax=unclassified Leptolyngbya TaxID=2650499 RepID=UPI003D31F63B